jgi:hypothetical protein
MSRKNKELNRCFNKKMAIQGVVVKKNKNNNILF